MLHLENRTPFDVNYMPVTNIEGIEQLSVFLSASLEFRAGRWYVAEEQMAAPFGDVTWCSKNPSSIRYPSQLCIGKLGTDIIVNGVAVAPNGSATKSLMVSFQLGKVSANAAVFGERIWHHGRISHTRTFEKMPITLENSFGGSRHEGGKSFSYELNPYGKGWLPSDIEKEELNGVFLPNIESIEALIQTQRDTPMPACWGAVDSGSPLRRKYAGTYDTAWQQNRAPFLPLDFNQKFFNSAIPALQYPGFIQGNETVMLRNLNHQSELSFQIPLIKPRGEVSSFTGITTLRFFPLTLVLETEPLLLRIFWQALAPIPRTLADIYEIKVGLGSLKNQ